MNIKIRKIESLEEVHSLVLIGNKNMNFGQFIEGEKEKQYVKEKVEQDERTIILNLLDKLVIIEVIDENEDYKLIENLRNAGKKTSTRLNKHKFSSVIIKNLGTSASTSLAYSEGIALGNYQFLKYFSNAGSLKNSLQNIYIQNNDLDDKEVDDLNNLVEAVYFARDLVNEPVSTLNAVSLANEIENMNSSAGVKVTLFDKQKISELGMGGLLAVNKGSIDPPTFTILEWKPKDKVNEQPYVLVGKGVVFDTGGLSLKPTKGSMDHMKSDMAGAAVVASS
ncbi:MAG: peptidase M17, partial [bacterium]